MAGYGWSYLVVTLDERAAAPSAASPAAPPAMPPGGASGSLELPAPVAAPSSAPTGAPRWLASDESTFSSEQEMFRELGVTGWELVAIREARGRIVYYFKRPRA
jgi:hypothetical protein